MRNPKAPRLLTTAILTTITVVFWIFFEVYKIFVSTPNINVPEKLLDPIDPSLNVDVLREIESKVYFEEAQIPETIITPASTLILPTPTPTIIESLETPAATGSANTGT